MGQAAWWLILVGWAACVATHLVPLDTGYNFVFTLVMGCWLLVRNEAWFS